MLDSVRLEIRASQIRARLNELSGADLTEETRTEIDTLSAEYSDVETKRRAALVAEDVTETRGTGVDAEARERVELRSKARVGHFVRAAMTGRPLDGASAEFADAEGCTGYLPLSLLAPEGETETRAVTPGPADETVTSTRPTVPFAFARSDAAALGISMPTVAAGEAHFPALTTAPPASLKAKDAAADATAAAFGLTKRTPGRLTGQFTVRMEDLALLPSMESDLREAISAQMAAVLDSQVIDGNGTAPNLTGLFGVASDVSAAGTLETFATGVSRFAALIDGKHANGWGDLRVLIGPPTFAKYAGAFQSNGDTALSDYLGMKLGLLRVSTRVPAKSGNNQKGLVVRAAQGQPIVVPIWKGLELITDPYTGAAKGQRTITAVSLVGSPFVPYTTDQVLEVNPRIA